VRRGSWRLGKNQADTGQYAGHRPHDGGLHGSFLSEAKSTPAEFAGASTGANERLVPRAVPHFPLSIRPDYPPGLSFLADIPERTGKSVRVWESCPTCRHLASVRRERR